MIVVVLRIRVTSGDADTPAMLDEAPRRRLPLSGGRGALADALAATDEVLRQLPAGVYAAGRPVLVGGREGLGEVAP